MKIVTKNVNIQNDKEIKTQKVIFEKYIESYYFVQMLLFLCYNFYIIFCYHFWYNFYFFCFPHNALYSLSVELAFSNKFTFVCGSCTVTCTLNPRQKGIYVTYVTFSHCL
jgi:hypothetical protein